MTQLQKQVLFGGAALLIAVLVISLFGHQPARSQPVDPAQCPQGARSCKVVILTPEEENTLTAPNGIFDTAVWANRAAFTDMTRAWREKLSAAPAGKVEAAKPEAKPDSMPMPPPRPKP